MEGKTKVRINNDKVGYIDGYISLDGNFYVVVVIGERIDIFSRAQITVISEDDFKKLDANTLVTKTLL
jgi:hypothetical protein